MIITTTAGIPQKEISEILGIVIGNSVRSRNIAFDITASIKNIIGGEISEYSKLMNQTRQQALDRMVDEAKKLAADAILNVRFTTTDITQATSEVLAYGTAVKIKK